MVNTTVPVGIARSFQTAFVIDDDPRFCAFLTGALSSLGFATQSFTGGLAPVEEALTRGRPVLIALDLSLGHFDAIEMMRSLALSRFAGGILLMSGHDRTTLDDCRGIGERLGLNMLSPLQKPFRLDQLRTVAGTVGAGDGAASGDILADALGNNWLELWYQPQFDLRTGTLAGAEGLIRVRHPQRGILAPAEFLRHGDELLLPLSNFVVRRALADWSLFAAAQPAPWTCQRLAVNVPVSVLQSKDFIDGVRRHLPLHPQFPGLTVEITEDEAIADPHLAREVATQLRLHKVGVAIDDYGVGYSTLARLDQLSFSELKLDRHYVDGCAGDRDKRDSCRLAVELARRFGMRIVAEGVESAADLAVLTDAGFDVAQGYLFSRPLPRDDFAKAFLGQGDVLVEDLVRQPPLRALAG